MHLLNILSLAPLLLLLSPLASSTPAPASATSAAIPAKPPGLAKLFTASLQLGKALKPIAIPGGIRLGKPESFAIHTFPSDLPAFLLPFWLRMKTQDSSIADSATHIIVSGPNL